MIIVHVQMPVVSFAFNSQKNPSSKVGPQFIIVWYLWKACFIISAKLQISQHFQKPAKGTFCCHICNTGFNQLKSLYYPFGYLLFIFKS